MIDSYLLLSFIAVFLYAGDTVITKYFLNLTFRSEYSTSFFRAWFRLSIVIFLFLAFGFKFVLPDISLLPQIFFYSLLVFLSTLTFLKTINHLDLSLASPLMSLRIVFSSVLALVSGLETYSTGEYFLLFLCVPLTYMLTYSGSLTLTRSNIRGFLYLFAYLIDVSLIALFANNIQKGYDFWNFVLCSFVLVALFNLAFVRRVRNDLKTIITPRFLYGISVVSLLSALAMLLQVKALASNVVLTSAIISSFPATFLVVMIVELINPGILEENSFKVYASRAAITLSLTAIIFTISLY